MRGRPLLPSSIVNLLAGCPAADANPDYCPLHRVRLLPVQEALEWATKLTTDDKAFLLQYHRCCLAYSLEEQRAAREKSACPSAAKTKVSTKHRRWPGTRGERAER